MPECLRMARTVFNAFNTSEDTEEKSLNHMVVLRGNIWQVLCGGCGVPLDPVASTLKEAVEIFFQHLQFCAVCTSQEVSYYAVVASGFLYY